MKIVYFYQFFSTPKGSWGTRVYEFAKEWVMAGHEVTVVTSLFSKSDLKAEKFIENQNFDGIQVKVLNILIDNKQPFHKRIWSFIQYSLVSSYYALTLPADVVIASSGPITVGIPGLIARYLRGRKLIFEVRDIWPEGAIELGVLKNKHLIKLAYFLEKRCYKAASYIITLSPGMTNNIKQRFTLKNITDITNSANIKLFSTKKELKDPNLRPGSYAIYTGNIGDVNNSYWLYHAAIELKKMEIEDIKIVLIGDGQQKKELLKLKEKEKLDNLVFKDLMPKEDLVAYIQNALVSLVPLKGTPILDTSSPNKFFESLAAGVPIIQNTNGWMKDFLEIYDVGKTLDPNNPKELANVLISMKGKVDETKRLQENSLRIAKERFDKRVLAKKYLDKLL